MIDRYVIAITPGNTHFLIHCDDGETMALQSLQDMVEGPIETVPSALSPTWAREPVDNILLIVNEEGKLMRLPCNENATDMSQLFGDKIVGNAVLMAARGDELIGFRREAAEYIAKQWLEEEA